MNSKVTSTLVAILAAFLFSVSPASNPQVLAAVPADEEFVMKAANGGKLEVELGRLALRRGRSALVKQFGRRMVTDHTRAGNQLKHLAARKGITLPGDMDAEGTEAISRLSALSGSEFDRAYMDMMVSDHEKDVSEFESEASSGADRDVKAFARKTLPTLKMHLRMARNTAARVRG
ncbi:MAG: DUF4142 domain-containing protein [Pyrinomonadaceae bacterium]